MRQSYLFAVFLGLCILLGNICVCSAQSATTEPNDAKTMQILNRATWKKDPGVKIVEVTFAKIGSDEYWDIYESSVKIKSCYTTKIQCSASGQFSTTNEDTIYSRTRNPFFSIFPIASIDKLSLSEGKGIVKVRKDQIDIVSSFNVRLDCDPVYSEHPKAYSPSHKYWKQFLPKKNECN